MRSWPALAAVAALTLAGFAVTGCGGGARPGPSATAAGDPASAAPAAAPSDSGPPIRNASAAEVLALTHRPGARAVVVNVWATWCGPCREELPDLLRVAAAYRARGVRLVLVTADPEGQRPAARRALKGLGVMFESYLKTGRDMEFIDSLNPGWSGALPATFIYDGHGRQVRFWEGKASAARFEHGVLAALEATPTSSTEDHR